jgi:uncharacterized protein (DUF302 family)
VPPRPEAEPDVEPATAPESVETKLSPRSVKDTVRRFTQLATSKGLKIFAVIDQQAEAQLVNLPLRETTLVVFGSPVAGTPIMAALPLAAIDLPLKIVVWSDDGQTKVSYTKPAVLAARYGLADEQVVALAGIDPLTDALVAE